LKLLVRQRGCFVIVDRGRALSTAVGERQLNESGELRKTSKMHKGQMVAADYTISPSVTFSNRNAGGGTAVRRACWRSFRWSAVRSQVSPVP
jgi:hypothetical protein